VNKDRNHTGDDKRTLITLLLDLEFLGEILVVLPFDLGPEGTIVHKISRVADLLLVKVRLLQNIILKVLVRAEHKDQLEARFRLGGGIPEIGNADISKVFESALVAISDNIIEPDVVSKGRKPKLRDATGAGRGVFGQRGVLLIVLDRVLLAGCDFLLGDCRRA